MTIDKAIEILSDPRLGCSWPTPRYEIEAITLGIEALKGIKKVRKTLRPYVEALLPGETEE